MSTFFNSSTSLLSTFFNSSTCLLSTFSNFLTKFRFFYFLSTFFNSSTCLFSTFFNSSTCLFSTFSYLLSKFSLFEFIYFSNSLLTKLYTQKHTFQLTSVSLNFSLALWAPDLTAPHPFLKKPPTIPAPFLRAFTLSLSSFFSSSGCSSSLYNKYSKIPYRTFSGSATSSLVFSSVSAKIKSSELIAN